jgi:hypothetical protein
MTAASDHLWRAGGALQVRRADGRRLVIREKETPPR